MLRFALLLSLLLLNACTSRVAVTPGTIPAPVYPENQNYNQAQAIANNFIKENGFQNTKNPLKIQKAQKVSRKVLMAAGYRPADFPVLVADAGDEVNAMVLNGSSIIIYEKLIDRSTEEELAVVLAHELGHILARHSEEHEEVSKQESAGTFSAILGNSASVAASDSGNGSLSVIDGSLAQDVNGAVGFGLFVGSYSREQEYEADHISLMLLAKAGYDPKAAPRFWAKEEQIFGSSNSDLGAFLITHPAASDRQDKLLKYLPLAAQYSKKNKRN